MIRLAELNKDQKYDFCIKLVSLLREYLKDDEVSSFVAGALDLCQAWNKDRSLNIAVDLYRYLDDEWQSFTIYQENEEDEKMIALWNCMIDAIAYLCRGAFEEQGIKYFPEPIEAVDDSIFDHLEDSFLQFFGNTDELDRIIER